MVDNPLYPRILQTPKASFFLFGPRGVGKSTWAKTHFVDAHRVDLLDESLYQSLLADPALFAAELRGLEPGSWVIVDEIQRLPSLLNEVHRFIEERKLRFVLLGSSARKLKVAGTNLLGGRALRKIMYPLLPEELGNDFDLKEVLRFGSLPVVWRSADRKEALNAYVQLYLREEIKSEALVRNLPGFARFLPIAGLFHGQMINVSNIARDAGIARTTVAGYLDILEDTLLTCRLPAFEGRLRVRERRHPKLYWIDPGLARGVKRQLGPVAAEERGPLFEGWVLNLLRAYAQRDEIYDEVYYWASAHGGNVEVDFLLQRGNDYMAIEAKSSQKYSSSHLVGLRAIADLPRVVKRVLVYTGNRALTSQEGILIWPAEKFADAVATRTLWP